MSDDFDKLKAEDDFDRIPTDGAGGGSGSEGGAQGGAEGAPSKQVPAGKKFGALSDFIKSWGNEAGYETLPQLEGGLAMVMQDAKNLFEGEPLNPKVSPLDAYKGVRDLGKEEHAAADDTVLGNWGKTLGMVMSPSPIKPKVGASIPRRIATGAAVGAPIGALNAAATSDVDLTKDDNTAEDYGKFLLETGAGGLGGGVAGGVFGGALGGAQKPARQLSRRLPMDILGVTTPGRRAMERQGIYDEAGDALLDLIKPGRSGMRKGSLTADALAELSKRGKRQGAAELAIDTKAPDGVQTSGAMHDAMRAQAEPYRAGTTEDARVAKLLDREAKQTLDSLGSTDPDIGVPLSLADAEAYKQRFGPAAAKKLKMGAEPAAKTTALGEAYSALRKANEDAAQAVDPALAEAWKGAKRDYSVLAAPLEQAGVDRSGMRAGDFDLGAMLSEGAAEPGSVLSKLGELPGAGVVKVPLDLAGRAYGRGTIAKLAQLLADKAGKNTGGVTGGLLGEAATDPLEPYLEELSKRPPDWRDFVKEKKK